jgi:hypothetical protein
MLKNLTNGLVLAIFAFWVFGFCLVAWNASDQSPTDQNTNRTSYAKNETKPSAPKSTAAVQPQSSPATGQTGNHEKSALETFFEFKLTDVLLVVFTAVLAYRTSGLFVETAGLRDAADKQRIDSLRSIKASELAAKAAQVSADTAKDSLLVSLRPLFAFETMELHQSSQTSVTPYISFALRNAGSNEVTLNKVVAIISTSPPGGMTLTEPTGLSALDGHATLERGQIISGNRVFSKILGVDEVADIKRGNTTLRVGFEVRSADALGNPYTQTYPFIFDASQLTFIRASLIADKK